jgi:hypothetical protein
MSFPGATPPEFHYAGMRGGDGVRSVEAQGLNSAISGKLAGQYLIKDNLNQR